MINKRVASLSPSLTLAITAKAKKLKSEGVDVVNFAGGEPDFDTSSVFKDAAVKALRDGMTRYTPAAGLPELRAAVARKLARDNHLRYDPSQIVVTVGAKHAVFNALQVVADEGDDVLIPAPYWLSYPEMVRMTGANPVSIQTTEASGFKVTARQLESAITAKSKVLILNSPSNPTGTVYSKDELMSIARVAVERKLIVISDEIYETLVYDKAEHYSIAALNPDLFNSVITINGLSKAFAMTGWRLGYLAARPEIAKAASSLQSHQTSNVTAFIQPAAIEALTSGQSEAKRIHDIFHKRRTLMLSELRKIPGLTFPEPTGAFYVFVNVSSTGLSSIPFAEALLDEAHIALVPGQPFGADAYVRISFATSEEQIKEGTERLKKWIENRA